MTMFKDPFDVGHRLTRVPAGRGPAHLHRDEQTVFMITHDIDEAMLLADRIVPMTNGPGAVIAEIVENTLPKDRRPATMHKHANYYALRNHLLDFLVTRSRSFASESTGKPSDPRSSGRPPSPKVSTLPRTRRAPQ